MAGFKSIVVMDLESSGLPAFGKPKITELSFVGVLTQHVLDCHKKNDTLPRVLQKLNLCFYPRKPIAFEATDMTGLDNFLLEEVPPFNIEACQMLSSFLRRMPLPICLVAHNGMKFDFQLLMAEVSAKEEVLPGNISCADSLLAFRAMLPINLGSGISSSSSHQFVNCSSPSASAAGSLVLRESGPSPQRHQAQTTCAVSTGISSDVSKEGNNLSKTNSEFQFVNDIQRVNETTPKQSKTPVCPPPLRKRSLLFNDENFEGSVSARKKLFREQEKLKSYKLVDIYRYLRGHEQSSGHHAENDTLALLECIVSTAPEFLAWIENNHVSLDRIPSMW